MKKYCFLFLMFLICTGSRAQNSFLDYGKAIKIYNQTTYEIKTYSYSTNVYHYAKTDKDFQLFQPSLAFQWKSGNRNFHEVGISKVYLKKGRTTTEIIDSNRGPGVIVDGRDILEAALALRYEYMLTFNKKGDQKFVPSLGLGAGAYYSLIKNKPHITNAFPTSETQVGLQLFVTPRLSYYFSPKWFLDINLPVCISDLNTSIFRVENPAFTATQQKNTDYTFTGFPKIFSGRIGIGLKL